MDFSTRTLIGEHDLVQQVRDLLTRSETLANEVARKEMILNSIEYKMFEVSNKVVKANDFGEWIDGVMQEKMLAETCDENHNQMGSLVDRKFSCEKQWAKMCQVLGKYIENPKPSDVEYLTKVDRWMVQRQCKEIKLEIENKEYRSLISNIEETISKFSDVCSVLKKHMKEKKRNPTQLIGDENCSIDRVDEWLTRRKHNEIKLEKENEEYKKIIANVENGISELDSKISTFTDCLNSCDITVHDKPPVAPPATEDSPTCSNTLLESIEMQIRSFNEENSEFQLKDFSNWMEKMKLKLNDLETNVASEKKIRNSKEKQHAMEREILNYLFNQKQKEISLLKEKVCNKVMSLNKPMPLARVEG